MNLDTQNLPPEVAAYIRSLEEKNQQLEKQLVKMQSLNEQLVRMRKRMFGQSSEQIQYVDAQQLDFFNEAEVCSDASAPEPGKTTPVKAHARKAKRTREELTEGIEHKTLDCELPETEKICARCGNSMEPIRRKLYPAGPGTGAGDEEKHGGTLHGSLCDAGEVSEWSATVSPGSLLEGSGRGAAAQHHGQLGDPQFPVV